MNKENFEKAIKLDEYIEMLKKYFPEFQYDNGIKDEFEEKACFSDNYAIIVRGVPKEKIKELYKRVYEIYDNCIYNDEPLPVVINLQKRKKIGKTWQEDTTYIECCCKDLDHLIRVHFEEDKFEIEYKLEKFPWIAKNRRWVTYTNNKWKNFIVSIKRRSSIIKNYFQNIWWAIKGIPLSYYSVTDLNINEASQLAKFIQKKIEERYDHYEQNITKETKEKN